MKNKKITTLAAGVIAAIGLLLSCSLDPYGEGLGSNSTGGNTSIIVPNIEGGSDYDNGYCTKPSAPSGVTASAQSSSSIKISWYSVSGASYYNVYRATSSYGTYSYVGYTASTSYTNTGLSSSTTYYYKVTAENSCGESGYSSYTYATTSSSVSYTAPSTPTGVSAQGISTDTILITWNSVSNATGYYVYYASSPTGTYTKAGPYYGTSLRLYGLTAGSTRYFKVSAYNSYGESSLSSYVSGTTKSAASNTSIPNAVQITLTSYKENGKHDVGLWGTEADPRISFIIKAYSSSGSLLSTNYSSTMLSLDDPSGGSWTGSKTESVSITAYATAYKVSVQCQVLDKDVSFDDDISPSQFWSYSPLSSLLNQSFSETAGTSYDGCIVKYSVKFIRQ